MYYDIEEAYLNQGGEQGNWNQRNIWNWERRQADERNKQECKRINQRGIDILQGDNRTAIKAE